MQLRPVKSFWAAIFKMATSLPPYCDVFVENFKSSEDMKKELLMKTWDGVVDFKFPARISGGTYRKAQSAWFKKYTWMRYSASTDGVYCAPCFLFGSRESRAKVLSNTPLTDWCNFSKVVERHVKSQHHEDQLIAVENYLAVASGESKDIECSLVSHYNAIVEKNRKILTAIVETIILCGKQNSALRGHDDSTSNFQALLHFQAKYNDILNVHLSTCCPRTRYTSPAIQNTLIGICGQLITADLVEDCNQSGAFGFIADEATDAATMEQMTLCVRFVDVASSQILEEFLGFSTTDSTTGEALANAFLENLNNLGVWTEHMRGQGYDGASNMSGIHRGVQARIRQVIPEADYTHCKAHCLNLAIVHASKERYAKNMMATVQQVAFAFNYSAKHLLHFQETLADDDISMDAMEERTKLRTLCETRWSLRADALHTFLASYRTVVTTLNRLAVEHGDAKAVAYRCTVLNFEFIITLVAVEHVLQALVPLSNLLQAKDCDLVKAVTDTHVVYALFQAERADYMVWDELFAKATRIAQDVDIQPTAPRMFGRQQHRPNAPAEDVSSYWKRNMYLPFVDHLMTELEARILQGNDRFSAQKLIPTKIQQDGLSRELITNLFQTFGRCIEGDEAAFIRECEQWCQWWTDEGLVQHRPAAPGTLGEALKLASKDLYPSVRACLAVLAVMPVSTAMAERSFSVMSENVPAQHNGHGKVVRTGTIKCLSGKTAKRRACGRYFCQHAEQKDGSSL